MAPRVSSYPTQAEAKLLLITTKEGLTYNEKRQRLRWRKFPLRVGLPFENTLRTVSASKVKCILIIIM